MNSCASEDLMWTDRKKSFDGANTFLVINQVYMQSNLDTKDGDECNFSCLLKSKLCFVGCVVSSCRLFKSLVIQLHFYQRGLCLCRYLHQFLLIPCIYNATQWHSDLIAFSGNYKSCFVTAAFNYEQSSLISASRLAFFLEGCS